MGGMYVCVYACMHVCMYACMRVHTCHTYCLLITFSYYITMLLSFNNIPLCHTLLLSFNTKYILHIGGEGGEGGDGGKSVESTNTLYTNTIY
jgi:hypothetical protein